MKNRFILACICFLFMAGCTGLLQAQDHSEDRFTFDFRGDKLSEVLDIVAREAGIDMVYDPEIVHGIHVYRRIQNQPVRDLLRNILRDTSLDFLTLSSGTIVIVKTVSDVPSFGSYTGKVIDSETGEPLPGASVMFADASGGTSTGPAGVFSFDPLMSGTYKIIFSYVGYEPVYKIIDVRPDQNTRHKISLKPKPVDFSPVIVTSHVPQMPRQGSETASVEANNRWEPAGRIQDAIQSLSLFSGVQYGLPMTDLHLQGGQRGEHRILLDGVPVYNPYSFGQMFSAFSPFAISKVNLYKAGYGVQEGSHIAGLISLHHDLDRGAGSRGLLQTDPLTVNGKVNLRLSAGSADEDSSIKVMVAGRSNYWDLYKEPRLNQTLKEWNSLDPLITGLLLDSENDPSVYEPREHRSAVRFHDIHVASEYAIDDYRTLSGSMYLGGNFVSTDLLRQAPEAQDLPTYLYARDEYRWDNLMAQLGYSHLVSSRLDINTQLSFTSNRFEHRYLLGTSNSPVIPDLESNTDAVFGSFQAAGANNLVPTQRSTNNIQHIILRTDGTYYVTPHFNLDGGMQVDYLSSRVDLSDLFYLPTLSDQVSTLFSSYLNGNWRVGEYWKLVLGNRVTLLSPSGRFYTEPRASMQYDQPDGTLGYWSVKVSGGLYRQFINQYEITNPGPTSLVPSFAVWSHARASKTPEAWHLSGSYYLEPAENTGIQLEAFYKWQPTTYIVSYRNLLQGTSLDRSGFDAFAETTEMSTLGGGIRLNQAVFNSKLKMMLGYDYTFNRMNLEQQFGKELSAPWIEPHRIQLRTLIRLSPELTAVAKWQSVLGRTWGFRQSYYHYLFYESSPIVGNFSFANPEDHRLSPFHQLDFSLIYEPTLPFMEMELRADLINVLNRRNTIDWSLQPPGSASGEYEIRKRTMPGFSPSVSIQFQF